MKKFFKMLFFIIILSSIGYLIYSAVVIVPANDTIVLYSKFNGKYKVIQKPFNIIFEKGIPYNAVIKKYPVQMQDLRFIFIKKLVLLDKEIDLLKYNIIIKYSLDMSRYNYLFDHYDSIEDVRGLIEEQFNILFHDKVNRAIESGNNLNTYPETAEKEISESLKEMLKTRGINIFSLNIINIELIPQLNYNRLKDIVDESFKYEENLKLDLRKIELEKEKQKKLAENEVQYLKIIGEYIKENPLILKYIMIKKISTNDTIFIPSHEIGFDFYDPLKTGVLKKFLEKNE